MDCSNQSSQSVITCRNSQGTELTANLLRTDMASTLSGVQHWLTGVDVGIRTTVTRRRDVLEKEIRECEESDLAEIDLLDFNAETLEFTRERIQEARMSGGRETPVNYFQRSLHQLLRAATQGGDDGFTGYDIVYCAGLFDYLSQRVCKRLVELYITMAKPGGLVIVTNVSDTNPSKAWMEYLVEWNLIYRGRKDMQDLVPDVPIKNTAILSDKTGVNLFLEIELANG